MKLSQICRTAFIATTMLILSSGLGMKGFAQTNSPQGAKNIVPVHGALAEGSCWSKVIALLQPKSFRVVAVQNPLTVRWTPLPPASSEAIPSWPAPFQRVQERADLLGANAAEATPHPWSSPASRNRRTNPRPAQSWLLSVPRSCRMLGCVLTRRTVAASDVSTLRTPAEMKPPTFR